MAPPLPSAARWFIAFRLGFSVRFYYPVFSLLFLDLGLSLEQFAMLNAVWAAAIVLSEVPLGALADVIGRRPLVITAALLMVAEMLLFLAAPLLGGILLLPLLVANRIASGLAEACASGADEALAFDALDAAGQKDLWPRVLERLALLQSVAFGIALLAGGVLYDAAMLTRGLQAVGLDLTVAPALAQRLPILATIAMALLAVVSALAMREVVADSAHPTLRRRFREAWANTRDAARWTLTSRPVRLLILAGLVGDASVRLVLTLQANYLVLIGLTPATFGLVGAALSLLGGPSAAVARRLVERHGRRFNFAAAGLVIFGGFVLLAPAWPGFGVFALIPLMVGFGWVGFFLSHYLNREVSGARRATILSFKGLAFNVGYGLATAAYGAATAPLTRSGMSTDAALASSLPGLPVVFLLLALAVSWLWRQRD